MAQSVSGPFGSEICCIYRRGGISFGFSPSYWANMSKKVVCFRILELKYKALFNHKICVLLFAHEEEVRIMVESLE